jgi:hypothetical protein
MPSPATLTAPRHNGHSIGFNLGVIALVLAMGGLGLAYGIQGQGHQGQTSHPAETVSRTLAGSTFDVPAAWLRDDGSGGGGFAKQVELTVSLPLGPEAAPRQIGITLMPRSRVRASASLLDGVYLHQFMPDQLSGPPGLVGKPLSAEEGFAGETVWYDPVSPQPFVAKCQKPLAEGEPSNCLRTIYLGPGIAAVYAFDEDVLMNWKKFDAVLHPLLVKIGAL